MMQEWGAVSPAQLICRPRSHPDVHQQACVETGRGCFPSTPYSIHPPQHAQPPCWQLQAFSQTINCVLSPKTHTLIRKGKKKSREVWFHRFFPTTIFKAGDDTTVGNKHLLGCVCSLKGLVLLPCLWVIRLFNTVLVDIRGDLAGIMGFTVMIKLWPHILQSVQSFVIYHINVISIILSY